MAGAGTAAASIALTKADPDTGDAAVYDGTALLAHGWATSDAGATYTQTGTYGTATLTTATGVVVRLAGDDVSDRRLNIRDHPPKHFETVGRQHQNGQAATLEVLLISQVLVGS